MDLSPEHPVGSYRVRATVGKGGWGTVYLAEHPQIGSKVAIKVLGAELARDDLAVKRFFNEARTANAIRSDHIVSILDFGQLESGQPFFIMEWLEGTTLGSLIEATPRLPMARVLHVVKQVCVGLCAAHRAGVVHRDLKPDNIFLQHKDHDPDYVKILDFGIAKVTGAGQGTPDTAAGSLLGTPNYMSPEQCAGARAVDHRADVYALGVILYELLTGRRPFAAEGVGELLVLHMQARPRSPRELEPALPPAFEALILQMLEKDPQRRPQSVDEVLERLAPVAGAPRRYRPPFVRRHRAALAGALLATALGGGALVWSMQSAPRPVNSVPAPVPVPVPVPVSVPPSPAAAQPAATPAPQPAPKRKPAPAPARPQKLKSLDDKPVFAK